jgi:predicted RNA-binding Zn-ribbon protein involved in translation (DUF1610 family)
MMSAASLAAALLQELAESFTEVAEARAEAGAAASAVEEPVVFDAAAIAHLKDMIRILSAKTKSQMCLEATCGEKGLGARLEDRASTCVDGSCPNCGFAKIWACVRALLVDVDDEGEEHMKLDVPPAFYQIVRWEKYAYRFKVVAATTKRGTHGEPRAAAAAARAGDDDDWEESPKSKELYVQTMSGTLIDFFDTFTPFLGKHVVHRSTLSRQKAAGLTFERERRPGMLSLDMDFAENLDIEEANKVQSEHWSTNQCTLFMQVAQWLDVYSWDQNVGGLVEGAEVTVGGEMAGEARAPGSYWAKVVSKPLRAAGAVEDSYVVENAAGVQHTILRSSLRHRVIVMQCYVGVTGDKRHDRLAPLNIPTPSSFHFE